MDHLEQQPRGTMWVPLDGGRSGDVVKPIGMGMAPSTRGFTLFELMITLIILSVSVLALFNSQAVSVETGQYANRLAQAVFLGNEIRELTFVLPRNDPTTGGLRWGPEPREAHVSQYDDLDDFDGANGLGLSIRPPINAHGEVMTDMDRWEQLITVENVRADEINGTAVADNATNLVRMTVRVFYYDPNTNVREEISRLAWVRAKDR